MLESPTNLWGKKKEGKLGIMLIEKSNKIEHGCKMLQKIQPCGIYKPGSSPMEEYINQETGTVQ